MKKSQLQQIIREEIQNTLNEALKILMNLFYSLFINPNFLAISNNLRDEIKNNDN
jgi:hypothetical protein